MEQYSVLMSVYVKEKPEYLKTSIESILGQTVLPEQFVIVQDGTLTPQLLEVIAEYQEKYPLMFTVVPQETNQGLGKALDIGLQYCRNELVARMDSDDISLPQRCEKQLARFAQNPELTLLGGHIDEFYDDPDKIVSSKVVPCGYEDIKRYCRRRNPFNHPTVMFKKSQVLRCGGYGDLVRCQDFDLFSRMVNSGCYAENLDETLLLFRSNEGNYQRRKSWKSCSRYIHVVKLNHRRGYCSLWDLLVVECCQIAMCLMPIRMVKWFSDRFLRKTKG